LKIKKEEVGRKKELPLLEKVTITDIGSEGNAIARVGNMVVFVPMLIPGDVADIKVLRKKKKYMEGIPVKFHEYSSLRQEPVCEHFGTCGGCKWQHLPYVNQLLYKEKQVTDNLTRIGKLEIGEIRPIKGSVNEYFYRNKLEYTFSNKRWLTRDEINSGNRIEAQNALGFHIPGLFDKVLEINKCHLQPEPSNEIRNAVRDFANLRGLEFFDLREQEGLLRNLIIRNTLDGQVMVIVVFYRDDKQARESLLDFISDSFPSVTSLMYIINPKRNDTVNDLEVKLYRGADHLEEVMDGLRFRISPKSFYQTNTRQATELYRTVKEFACLTGTELVYDLYTGTGTIANYVAGSAAKVIGLEYIEDAVKDAVGNSLLNNITNTSFHSGDIREILSDEFIFEYGRPDVVITDPPRAGMHEDVIRSIIRANPGKIVYVSCNPATQARDIQMLSEHYNLSVIQPVDMFPHTHHVENVALLLRRQ
jgi:23S rRNA (uracil1939-C5)-methyltransferase